ncbi:BA75_04292T0 [Komagataella pastoris]|uniref:Protein ROT1 n=1 Tax=Komagataella pastoris TaxID=4922 RepID=A0A1B2JEC8_PICPA|nr:BA75_04292T0 [Komagataella pastoris]
MVLIQKYLPLFAYALFSSQQVALADDTVPESELTIVGTWSSKSNTVFTGSGFYDPVDELLIEPDLPGISYSFTDDGYFEEALYQVAGNAKDHHCPTAVLIFQHGTYTELDNGTLVLEPYDVDGRQLLSQPCDDKGISTYSRYNQTEVFRNYEVSLNTYHGRIQLQLYASDGVKQPPLYLAYRPPNMLPTIVLNPTAASDEAQATATGASAKIKRSLENRYRTNAVKETSLNYTLWWWVGAILMGAGSTIYFLY